MADNRQIKREIRRALLGHTIQQEDGTLKVVQPGQRMIFQGVRNGWGSVRIFGVGRTRRQYTGASKEATEQVIDAFRHVGRSIALENLPEEKACLCRLPFGAPVLLTAGLKEDRLEISAYAGRSPIAPLHRLWLLRSIERRLPENLTRIKVKSEPRPVREKRKKRKQKDPDAEKHVREKKQKSKKK